MMDGWGGIMQGMGLVWLLVLVVLVLAVAGLVKYLMKLRACGYDGALGENRQALASARAVITALPASRRAWPAATRASAIG